jgi:hypothetical protein
MHYSPEEAIDMKTLAVTTKHEEFGAYIDAKVLTTTEIHAAERITDSVLRDAKNTEFIDYLSVAMAVWAPANGHVCVNLGSIQDQVREEIGSSDGTIDLDLFNRIKWTDTTQWLAHLRKSLSLIHI